MASRQEEDGERLRGEWDVTLSQTQRDVLRALARGERPKQVPAVTRRWLAHRGLIVAVKRRSGSRTKGYDMTITDLGREVLGSSGPSPESRFVPESLT